MTSLIERAMPANRDSPACVILPCNAVFYSLFTGRNETSEAGEADGVPASQDAPQAVDLSEMVVEVSTQVNQELMGG